MHQGKGVQGIERIQRILTSYSVEEKKQELSEDEPALNHYERYEKLMDGTKGESGGCVGCRNEGGIHDCKVRSCARDRGYRTCLDCIRMETCSELKE